MVNLTQGQSDLLLAAVGFRNTTRVASSNSVLWESILTTNRPAIIEGRDMFVHHLARMRFALENNRRVDLWKDLDLAHRPFAVRYPMARKA